LHASPGVLSELVPVVCAEYGTAYPELIDAEQRVKAMVLDEELAFATTLGRGIKYFDQLSSKIIAEKGGAAGEQEVPGDAAFFLYDSLGFPIDLTQLMAEERGLVVDTDSFDRCMTEQQERSRAAGSGGNSGGSGDGALVGIRCESDTAAPLSVRGVLGTEEVDMLGKAGLAPTADSAKYEQAVGGGSGRAHTAMVVAVVEHVNTGDGRRECRVRTVAGGAVEAEDAVTVGLVLNETPFYAEAGGQVADAGTISSTNTGSSGVEGVKAVATVVDVQRYGGYVLHTVGASLPSSIASPPSQVFDVGSSVHCTVDVEQRQLVAPNHSATHLVAHALRQVLGTSVDQRGSHNNADRLRFDFSHTSAMTENELALVQEIVREEIEQRPSAVFSAEVPLAEALSVNGMGTIPGEAYPDPVRVVVMGSGAWRVRPNDSDEGSAPFTSFDASTTPSSIDDILAAPEHAEWPNFSVELCGGTHVGSTSEIEAFSIIEESSVSRRHTH
jgi:alanyl-tRNA synthetase